MNDTTAPPPVYPVPATADPGTDPRTYIGSFGDSVPKAGCDGWVRVEDGLPEHETPVQAYDADPSHKYWLPGYRFGVCTMDRIQDVWFGPSDIQPTHWCPLPDPPSVPT